MLHQFVLKFTLISKQKKVLFRSLNDNNLEDGRQLAVSATKTINYLVQKRKREREKFQQALRSFIRSNEFEF